MAAGPPVSGGLFRFGVGHCLLRRQRPCQTAGHAPRLRSSHRRSGLMALAVHENVFRFSHIGQIEIPQDSDCRQCSGLLPRRWGAPSFGAKYDRRKGLASTVTIERNHISRTLPALALAACSLVQGASVAHEPHAAPIASIYTDISPRECKLLKVETESGGSARDCRGPTGYRLII